MLESTRKRRGGRARRASKGVEPGRRASRDTQIRMLKIIKVILANLHSKDVIFSFGKDVMMEKWRKLGVVVSRPRLISLQKIPPQCCTYFDKIREPSPEDVASSLDKVSIGDMEPLVKDFASRWKAAIELVHKDVTFCGDLTQLLLC